MYTVVISQERLYVIAKHYGYQNPRALVIVYIDQE